MKRLLLLLFLLAFMAGVRAQQPRYDRLRIDLENHRLQELARLGIEADHGRVVPGQYLVNDFSSWEKEQLARAGIPFEVLIPKVGQWYAEGKQKAVKRSAGCHQPETYPYETPDNYQAGSMAGYFTYDEMLQELNRMAELYPNLISPLQQVDSSLRTQEGHPIFWLRVSDNPLQEEAEPEVLYTALHHAREPNSLSQMIFYLWYLLEQYGNDPEVTYLVDNTAMYFVPCVNPDGYIFNQLPGGGGLWRKNRREIDGEKKGVDLNRNYGYQWGTDDFGSSPNPDSPVYRGPAPFSEPETRAIKQLCERHNFQISLNYHTYGNLLIHPWGYNDAPTAEDALFKGFGGVLTEQNSFRLGTATETVGYIVNGSSDDWMYGATNTKNKTYAYTPEVGSYFQGFWPNPADIDHLNKSCLWQNLAAAHLLLQYVEVRDNSPSLLLETQGSVTVNLRRLGLGEGSVSVEAAAASPNVSVEATPQTFDLNLLETDSYTFDYTISPGEELLETVRFDIRIDNGSYTFVETLEKAYQNAIATPLLSSTAEAESLWTSAEDWGITSEHFTSPPYAFTDSPFDEYAEGAESFFTLSEPVLLEGGEVFLLQFNARWLLEEAFDYAQLSISADGEEWTALCGRYSQAGNGNFQPSEPVYNGLQEEWVREQIDLTPYRGEEVYFRFSLKADNFVELDGFYFDDFTLIGLAPKPTGTADIDQAVAQCRIYPNPAIDHLYLDVQLAKEVGKIEAQLINGLGQRFGYRYQTNPSPEQLLQWQFDTRALPGGIYLLQIMVDGAVVRTKQLVVP